MRLYVSFSNYGRIVFPGYTNNTIEDPNTIVYIMVCNHCICITFADGSQMVQAVSLCYVLKLLNPEVFFRCDHNYIVNGNFVYSLRRRKRGLWILFKNHKEITVSWRKKNKFLDFIISFYTSC